MNASSLFMHELLWKPDDGQTPIEDREYYELSLDDVSDPSHPYRIWRTHYEWDGVTRQLAPADHIIDKVKTLAEAEARYAVHLKILADLGFTESDMASII